MKANNKQENEKENAAESDKIIKELKRAYRTINALQKTPSHRKIVLDVERKLRIEDEKSKGSSA